MLLAPLTTGASSSVTDSKMASPLTVPVIVEHFCAYCLCFWGEEVSVPSATLACTGPWEPSVPAVRLSRPVWSHPSGLSSCSVAS